MRTNIKTAKRFAWAFLALAVLTAPAAWAGVTVSWIAPADGTVYNAIAGTSNPAFGGPISLTASATATQGYTVSKVEFFYGSTLIGAANSNPYYTFNSWYPVPVGTYAVYAKATAVKGSSIQTATTPPVNIIVNDLPIVTSVTPAKFTHIPIGTTSVAVSAVASDPDGTVTKVDFYADRCAGGSTLIATITTPPYSFNWTIPQPYYDGSGIPLLYCVYAVATDNRGATTASDPGGAFILVPAVSIASPANGATYPGPANISLSAVVNPSDFGGKVQYYNGTTLIGESTTSPYAISWQNVPSGNYSLTARVSVASSAPINVTVTAGPQLYFIEPDHLDTPRLIADSAGNTVWRNDNSEPFGDSVADENPSGLGEFQFDLGFMGQRRDRETGLWYNGQRDAYNAAIGGYTQPEPLGVEGDINLYRYARSNPLSLVDPDGRQAQAAGAACGPYALVCVAGITAVYYATVTGIKAKSGAANDACYDDPCERRQKVLLKWYTNLLASMAGNRHVGWGLVLIREAHRYNKTAAVHNSVCPKAQVPYIGVSPYFDVIPGGQPPDLSDIYLRGP